MLVFIMCVCEEVYMCYYINVKVKGHSLELVLSFQYVSPGDGTQVIRFCRKHFYLLSQLFDPSDFHSSYYYY